MLGVLIRVEVINSDTILKLGEEEWKHRRYAKMRGIGVDNRLGWERRAELEIIFLIFKNICFACSQINLYIWAIALLITDLPVMQ